MYNANIQKKIKGKRIKQRLVLYYEKITKGKTSCTQLQAD